MPYRFSPSVMVARNIMGAFFAPLIVGLILLLHADTYSFAGIARGVAGAALIAGTVAVAAYLWKRI